MFNVYSYKKLLIEEEVWNKEKISLLTVKRKRNKKKNKNNKL